MKRSDSEKKSNKNQEVEAAQELLPKTEYLPTLRREVRGLNEKATAIFRKLVEGLKWGEDDSQRCRVLDNAKGTFQALHIEVIYGWQDGSLLVSLAHYGQLNGDLMKDPDMTFVLSPDGKAYPCTYQNDWMGVFQSFMSKEQDGLRISHPRQYRDACSFAATWMDNIQWQQGIKLTSVA